VLVLGASGAVGSYVVQVAKAAGAEVTGVCSEAKADFVRGLGADQVLDYNSVDPTDGSTTYDAVIDIGGNRSLARLRRALVPGGTLVVVGGEEGGPWTGGFGRSLRAPLLSLFVSERLVMLLSKEHHSGLERLAEMVADGRLVPALDRVFPLDRAADAMRLLDSGQVRGKVGVSIA
jgi:NADPH:quinone reductase-like Zn-dependent oxidoreductase